LVRSVPAGPRPRVFVALGVAPIFTVGDRSYIAHLLSLAGARNAASDLHAAYGRYSAEALIAAQPDAIVTDAGSNIASVLGRAPWNALRAVREHRVYVLADADLLERPGPRFTAGLQWLIERLHPRASRR
jgi:iron complex transport system substrate-binding protein